MTKYCSIGSYKLMMTCEVSDMKLYKLLDKLLILFGILNYFSILAYGATASKIFIATFIGSGFVLVLLLLTMVVLKFIENR